MRTGYGASDTRRTARSLYDRLGYTYAGPYRNEPGGSVYDLLLLQVDNEAVAR